jgi:hypothetical protein
MPGDFHDPERLDLEEIGQFVAGFRARLYGGMV